MDIKKPDLSVVLEKLSFLRNNLALLVPIVLVVVAGLLYIPTTLFSRSLDRKIQSDSVNKGTKLDNLQRNGVVRKDQWEIEKQNLAGNAQDANEMKRLNEQCVQRSLLSYRIFPVPTDMASQKYEDFGKAFCNGVVDMIRGTKGTVPPTPEELGMDAAMMGGAAGGGAMGRNLYGRGAEGMRGRGMMGRDTMMRGGVGAGVGAMEDLVKQARDIQDAVCSDKALAGAVYVTPADIAGYDFWSTYAYNTGRDEAIKTCWYWQHGYWIVEDVFQTVDQCNQGADNVFSSPVKRVVSLNYEQDLGMDMAGGGGMGRGMGGYDMRGMGMRGMSTSLRPNMPQFVKTGPEALATPCTAHYTNEEFNIIHFNVSVVVEASYQVEFMKALCSAKTHTFRGFKGDQPPQEFKHNQITILAIQVKPVVRRDVMHDFYRYGEDAVVELSLTCEYLLPKAGYADLVPEVVKETAASEEL